MFSDDFALVNNSKIIITSIQKCSNTVDAKFYNV